MLDFTGINVGIGLIVFMFYSSVFAACSLYPTICHFSAFYLLAFDLRNMLVPSLMN